MTNHKSFIILLAIGVVCVAQAAAESITIDVTTDPENPANKYITMTVNMDNRQAANPGKELSLIVNIVRLVQIHLLNTC